MSRGRLGVWQVDEQLEARPHHTRAKEEGDEVGTGGMLSDATGADWQPTCTKWEFLLK